MHGCRPSSARALSGAGGRAARRDVKPTALMPAQNWCTCRSPSSTRRIARRLDLVARRRPQRGPGRRGPSARRPVAQRSRSLESDAALGAGADCPRIPRARRMRTAPPYPRGQRPAEVIMAAGEVVEATAVRGACHRRSRRRVAQLTTHDLTTHDSPLPLATSPPHHLAASPNSPSHHAASCRRSKTKAAPTAMRAKPTAWFQVSCSLRWSTEKMQKTTRVMTSSMVSSWAAE